MRSPFAALSRERMGAPEVAADAEDAVAFQPRNVLRRSTDEHASPVRSPPPPRPSPAWGGAGAPDRVRAEGTGEEAREEPAPEAMSSPSPVRPSAPMSPPTGPRASPGVAADSRVVVESLDARARRLGLPMGLSAPASPPVSQPQLQPPQWLPRPIPPGADRGEAALLADAALRASWGSRSSLGDSRGGGRAVPGVGASWEGSWDGMAPLEVSSTVLPDGPQAWEEGSEPPPAGGPSEAGDASLSALPADTRFLPVPSGSGGGGGPEGGVGSQVRQSAPVRGGGGGELSRMYNSADYSTPVADRQGWGRQSQWARSPGGWDEESAGEALLRERQRREAAEAEARQVRAQEEPERAGLCLRVRRGDGPAGRLCQCVAQGGL